MIQKDSTSIERKIYDFHIGTRGRCETGMKIRYAERIILAEGLDPEVKEAFMNAAEST